MSRRNLSVSSTKATKRTRHYTPNEDDIELLTDPYLLSDSIRNDLLRNTQNDNEDFGSIEENDPGNNSTKNADESPFGVFSLNDESIQKAKSTRQERLGKLDKAWADGFDKMIEEYMKNLGRHGIPRYSETHLFDDSCNCVTKRAKHVLCVYLTGIKMIKVDFCNCRKDLLTLIRHHLFPASPTLPATTFHFTYLEFFALLQTEVYEAYTSDWIGVISESDPKVRIQILDTIRISDRITDVYSIKKAYITEEHLYQFINCCHYTDITDRIGTISESDSSIRIRIKRKIGVRTYENQ
ncbi:hypothetical protein BDA99DRAFT_536851 [Phascolomyces articulosus]|uniref:CxC2-like cysteine cluster KDZ transposase-associated domain-containing protein n=1 Tax=Phascolomyces articulosus TaxID=60185 RepID=A0AAD5K0Y5_9FUNG|nr:hypothetical protein BDA99DRAFT_536851 [Phascolomyces articulosus]